MGFDRSVGTGFDRTVEHGNKTTTVTVDSYMEETLEPICKPYPGRPGKYQIEVCELWMHYHDDTLPHLAYLAPECGTELCTEVEHLQIIPVHNIPYPRLVCVYCGQSGYTRDHILPVTWTGEAARRGVVTVPACGECNSAIGDAYAPSITMRRRIAHKFIAKRYRKTIRMILPTPEELDEYGPGLRSYIEHSLVERELILDRLAWPPGGYDERACSKAGIDPWEAGLIHDEG